MWIFWDRSFRKKDSTVPSGKTGFGVLVLDMAGATCFLLEDVVAYATAAEERRIAPTVRRAVVVVEELFWLIVNSHAMSDEPETRFLTVKK